MRGVTVSKFRDDGFVTNRWRLSPCGREGKATASLPECILSVFPPDSPPERGVPLLAQVCVSALNVTLSVYLKESLLGLLCCEEHVRKWGVYRLRCPRPPSQVPLSPLVPVLLQTWRGDRASRRPSGLPSLSPVHAGHHHEECAGGHSPSPSLLHYQWEPATSLSLKHFRTRLTQAAPPWAPISSVGEEPST